MKSDRFGRPMNDLVGASSVQARRPRSVALLVPLLVFIGIGIFLGIGLTRDPREVASPLLGKPVPAFSLPPGAGSLARLGERRSARRGFARQRIRLLVRGMPEEHPVLIDIQRAAIVPLHGLNYKDRPADAAAWLAGMGDPYTRTGADLSGRAAIDWGVYGVPETFVVDREGRIAYKHIGPITPTAWNDKLVPMIRKVRSETSRIQ